jgi:hypothetical protein
MIVSEGIDDNPNKAELSDIEISPNSNEQARILNYYLLW